MRRTALAVHGEIGGTTDIVATIDAVAIPVERTCADDGGRIPDRTKARAWFRIDIRAIRGAAKTMIDARRSAVHVGAAVNPATRPVPTRANGADMRLMRLL